MTPAHLTVIQNALRAALERYATAHRTLLRACGEKPIVSRPRIPRHLVVGPYAVAHDRSAGPAQDSTARVLYVEHREAHVVEPRCYPAPAYQSLVAYAGGHPARALMLVRQLDHAAAWCEARMEGAHAARAQILAEQAGALEALEADLAAEELAEASW